MNRLRFFLIFILGFISYFFVDVYFFSLIQIEITSLTQSKATGHIFAYIATILPLLITTAVLCKDYKRIPENLGLSKSLIVGIAFAFIASLPMFLAYAIKFSLNNELSLDTIIIKTISSAFFEEVIYRAFLFGIVYRYTRLGFIPAVLFGSVLFAIAHLYQSTEIHTLIGIFLLTFFGSILFAWIYIEWNFNLWTAICLHCFMNLYWILFNVDNTAMGGTYANIFRFLSIFLAIAVTIQYKKKTAFEVNKNTWWIKPRSYN